LQIYGDPEAADVVFTSGADVVVVGINITTQVQLTGGIVIRIGNDFSVTISYLFLFLVRH